MEVENTEALGAAAKGNRTFWPRVTSNLERVNLGLVRECLGSAASVETRFFAEFETKLREVKLSSEVRALCIYHELQRQPALWNQLLADETIVIPKNTGDEQGRIIGILRALSYRPDEEPYSTGISRSALAVRGLDLLCTEFKITPAIAMGEIIFEKVRDRTQKELHALAKSVRSTTFEGGVEEEPTQAPDSAVEPQPNPAFAEFPDSVEVDVGSEPNLLPASQTPTSVAMSAPLPQIPDDDITRDFAELGTLSGPATSNLAPEYSVVLVRKVQDEVRAYLIADGRIAANAITQFAMELDVIADA